MHIRNLVPRYKLEKSYAIVYLTLKTFPELKNLPDFQYKNFVFLDI